MVEVHCSGVRPIQGCLHKFHHFTEQNVIGSARIVCLCFYKDIGVNIVRGDVLICKR